MKSKFFKMKFILIGKSLKNKYLNVNEIFIKSSYVYDTDLVEKTLKKTRNNYCEHYPCTY